MLIILASMNNNIMWYYLISILSGSLISALVHYFALINTVHANNKLVIRSNLES